MTVVCVAVISRENTPLYLRSFSSQTDELKFAFIVHSSLDLLAEKSKNIIEPFLGMLHPTENFHVFGYMSNTDTKLIAVLDENDAKDQDPKAFLEALHNLYLNTISNPFYVMGTPIRSNYFETEIAKLIVAGAS